MFWQIVADQVYNLRWPITVVIVVLITRNTLAWLRPKG